MAKKQPTLGPRTDEATVKFYKQLFGSTNAGAEFVVNAFHGWYRRTLHDLKGVFTADELMLMIDRHNGVMLSPDYAGQSLALGVRDSIELDRTDQKWNVDKDEFLAKIEALSLFTRACLEVWAVGFWEQKDGKKTLEEYVSDLAKPANTE